MEKGVRIKAFLYLMLASFALLLACFWLAGGVLGWYQGIFNISKSGFRAGSLSPSLNVYFYNQEGGWQEYEGEFYAYFGEINDITRLPDPATVYLKLKVEEGAGIAFSYDIRVEDVEIILCEYKGSQLLSEEATSQVGYFTKTPSQKCFDLAVAVGADNQLPAQLTFSPAYQLENKGHSLTAEEFIDGESYLYLRVDLRLEELQNIFKSIKASYMPYAMEFLLHLSGISKNGGE